MRWSSCATRRSPRTWRRRSSPRQRRRPCRCRLNPLVTPKQIATNQAMVSCDVCGRTLLRGEHADVFLHSGQRRNVCELCTQRAALEGWIREGLVDDMPVRQRGRRERGSLFGRLRSNKRPVEDEEPSTDNGIRRHGGRAAADEPLEAPVLPYGDERDPTYVAEVAPAPAPR